MVLYSIIAANADASALDGSGHRPNPVAIHATQDLEMILIIPEAAKELVERRPNIARDLGLTIEARTRMVDELSQTSTLEF